MTARTQTKRATRPKHMRSQFKQLSMRLSPKGWERLQVLLERSDHPTSQTALIETLIRERHDALDTSTPNAQNTAVRNALLEAARRVLDVANTLK